MTSARRADGGGRVVIVSPALADANNGNWQTARRWQHFLRQDGPVRIVKDWPDAEAAGDGVLLALHARRSAAAVAAWHRLRGARGLAVVLTGTDLYRDIASDPGARRSLELADRLVVLQELGPRALPEALRAKARVILQSTSGRQALTKTRRRLTALMVGHLREEKSPETLFAAARLLADQTDLRLDHVGTALEPRLAEAARATMAACPGYRWLGGLPHEATRRRIQRAHLLVHASRLEGGAHVVMEAVCSGTPVLASRIDGNVGMLGEDYEGYFPWGDAAALAQRLLDCRTGQGTPDGLLARLADQCRQRAPVFLPERERQQLRALVAELRRPPA